VSLSPLMGLKVIKKFINWCRRNKPQISQAELWRSYLKQVEEAKHHPTTTMFHRYFLTPQSLTNDERENIEVHIRRCSRCQDVESYYHSYRDFLRLGKYCD